MKKKILILSLILILTLSMTTIAKNDNTEHYSEILMTTVDGANIIDTNLKGHINHLAYKINASELDYGIISGTKFDFLVGYNFDYTSSNDNQVNSSILVGVRKSEYNDGFMATWDTRNEISDEFFIENSIGIVSWNDQYGYNGSTYTNWRLTLGYNLSETMSTKGGISSYSSGYNTDYGLTFGIQNEY